MEPEPVPLLWVLGVGVPLALLLGSAVRWVTRGELLVVTRRGVIVRSRGPGPAVHLPLVEHARRLPAGPEELPLVVRARTRDGSDVRVLLTAVLEVVAPPAGRPFADPCRAASAALAREVAVTAARLVPPDLVAGLTADVNGVAERADAAARTTGARVHEVLIDEIELLLGPPTPSEALVGGSR